MPMINEKGFSLVETLTSLITILMILSLSFPWFHMLKSPDYYNELSVHQLFTFLQEEINSSHTIVINQSSITFSDQFNRSIIIDQYHDIIRRRVDGVGHETLLQEVIDIEFEKSSTVLIMSLTMKEGETYKKNIFLPSNQSARRNISLDYRFSYTPFVGYILWCPSISESYPYHQYI